MQQRLLRWCRENRYWLLLGVVFGFHAVTNAVWIQRDLTLRAYDAGPHIEATARAYDVAAQQGLRGVLRVARGERAGIWPSAGYLPWLALAGLFGLDLAGLRLFNLVFSGVLLLSVFLLGERLRSPRVGLLAAVVLVLFPGVYGESRQFGIDFPGAAVAALALLLLLRTEKLARPRAALLLGVVVGLGVLVRPQVLFFVAVPSLTLLGISLHSPPAGVRRRRILLSAGLALAGAALASAVWWLGRLDQVMAILHEHQEGEGYPLWMTPAFYAETVPWILSPMLIALFGVSQISEAASWRRRGGHVIRRWLEDPTALLIWLCVISGLVLHSLLRVRCVRYLIPLCPFVAVLTAAGLQAIRWRWPRRAIIALGLGAATLIFFADSFVRLYDFGWRPLRLAGAARQAYLDDLHITSGPPLVDPQVLFAERVARDLRRRHGAGRGLLVALRNTVDTPEFRFRLAWHVTPVLRVAMPGLRATGQTYYERRGPNHLSIGGAEIPEILYPITHCYLLTQHRRGVARAGPTGATLRQRLDAEAQGRPVRLSLWELPRCTRELEEVEGLD